MRAGRGLSGTVFSCGKGVAERRARGNVAGELCLAAGAKLRY